MELEKQVIMEYLRIAGIYEWHIMEINKRIRNIDCERQQLFNRQTYTRQQFSPPDFYSKKFFDSLLKNVIIGFIFFSLVGGCISTFFPSMAHNFLVIALVIILSLSLTIFLFRESKGWAIMAQYKKAKSEDDAKFNDFELKENQRLADAPARDAALYNKRQQLTGLLNKATHDLQQAYELDILYIKYRNFTAVFAMYEYFQAGSADTLKEAINKYDNESRLDNIISQLSEINETTHKIYDEMLYQTRLAQDTNMLARQQLEYAKIAAVNSYQSAQYSKITALNTSLLVFMNDWSRV